MVRVLWIVLIVAASLSPASARDLTIVSWNLQWFPGRIPFAKSEARQQHMAAAQAELRALDPDVFLAQEITSERAFRELVSVLPGMQVAVVSSFDRMESPKAQQVGIATRLPTRSAWSAMWEPAPHHPPRGYALAAIDLGEEGTLLVYNVHLKSNRTEPGLSLEQCVGQREEAVRQLLQHVETMSAEFQRRGSVAAVVAGDFNTNREHLDLAAERTLALMAEAGFVDGWQGVALPQRLTWMGSPDFPPCTFDYFFTRGIVMDNVEVLAPASEASDHRPVVGRVDLRQRSNQAHAGRASGGPP